MDWQKAALAIDRFHRMACATLRDLEQSQSTIETLEIDGEWAAATREKQQARMSMDQLVDGLHRILALRTQLSPHDQGEFDAKMQPIRMNIQTTINNLRAFCNLPQSRGTRESPVVSPSSPSSEMRVQATVSQDVESMRLRAEQAKMDAEATRMLAKDVDDINQIMLELGNLVHAQHDMVDSIEEHCERAEREVRSGERDLKRAAVANSAKYPLAAAVVGGVVVGGPVGLAAGSAIAGVLTAVLGAVGGFYGGNALKRNVQNSVGSKSTSTPPPK